MTLVAIDLGDPDDEDFEDSLAARVLLLVLGLLLWRMGYYIWGSVAPSDLLGPLVSIVVFATGTQVLVFAASDLDYQVWGPRIAWAVLVVFTLGILALLTHEWLPVVGTDAMLFSREGVEALAAGQNPYRLDMTDAIREWRGPRYATPRIDGTVVQQLSYPAGAVVWFLPQELLVGATLVGHRLTLVAAAVAVAAVLIHDSPPALAMAPLVVLLAVRNAVVTAAGGVLWPLWVLPLLLGLREWYRERWTVAAVWVGLACGTKQLAWAVLPFLAIWVYRETDGLGAFARRAGRLNAAGAAGVLLLNLPFIIWDPGAWLDGVLTPVGGAAPLVHQGVGLAILPWAGVAPLPTWWYAIATVATTAVALTAYWLFFNRLRWAAWVLPPLIFLAHSRSLASYFIAFAPLALAAVLANWGRLEVGEPVSRDLRRWIHAD